MPWRLRSLTVGWPPQVVIEHTDDAEEQALHELFAFLETKRLLRHGYGTSAGITSLSELADRIDAIRNELFRVIARMPPEPP